jgi:hypothetical protein
MLDNEAIRLMREAKESGHVISAMTYESLIIPWGSDCCHGCENYQCGKSITAHGFCPIKQRGVSPHYYCSDWGQD